MLRKRLKSLIFILALIILIIELLPAILLFLTSIKTNMAIWTSPTPFHPFTPTIEQYIGVFKETTFVKNILNSTYIAVWTTLLSVLGGALASYALARFPIKRKKEIAMGIIFSRMIPQIALAVPIYSMMRTLGLLDTYTGLILAHTTFSLPYVVWLLLPFFQQIPVEYEEAALIDGCNKLQVFSKIFLPLASSGIIVAMTFCFLGSWNDFIYTLVLSNVKTTTAPMLVTTFVGMYAPEVGKMSAAGILIILPVFLIALFLQKYIIMGLSGGGIKG
ncbi:MAG: ABC transporter permease [Dictyoglomus sp. NZ13-RE01]|nr:MAG: ABC transporter permease [Dictyoglomus sp. NZ13-RE01]